MRISKTFFSFAILVGTFSMSNVSAQTDALQPFPLSSVRLLDGPFKQAQQTDMRYILALDPDRLLAPYRKEAGLEPKAPNYGNWENTGLDGHIGGHYLSALSLMYAATGNDSIKQRFDYVIKELEACQNAAGNGYLSGVPGGKSIWKDISEGKIKAASFSLNDRWVPLYNIHKIFAGLYDAATIAESEKAWSMLLRLCDWWYATTKNLSDDQVQEMLKSEHGGLNEVFALVARRSKDPKYIEMARRFSDLRILNPLMERRDALTGIHANTQIPKVIGFQEVAVSGNDTTWNHAADYFWNTVVHNRSVTIGGNSVREHFHPADDFSSMLESREGPETCNSYNMLKLTKALFLSHPSSGYMDYYERTMYNHILSSQHPNGGFVYFTPMRPGHYRVYSQPQQGFWCCVGSGIENHGKYGEMIYAKSGDDLYVNMFIASSLDWKEKGISVQQQTRFPYEEKSVITLEPKKSAAFTVFIRKPSWVKNGKMQVEVNGKKTVVTKDENGYLGVKRTWKKGDKITLTLPMETQAVLLPDGSNWVSFLHGPMVLAAEGDTTGLIKLFADDSRMGHIASGPVRPLNEAPMLVGNTEDLAEGLQAQDKSQLRFQVKNTAFDKDESLRLKPFYEIHGARYTVYFPFTTPDQLDAVKKEMEQREREAMALEAATVDKVNPGEQQPESDHGFKGENTETGLFRERLFRNAKGWFSYKLNNPGGQAKKLSVTYHGRERNRDFAIYMADEKLVSVSLKGEKGEGFYEEEYLLPDHIARNPRPELRFVAEEGSRTANIFEVRLLK